MEEVRAADHRRTFGRIAAAGAALGLVPSLRAQDDDTLRSRFLIYETL
jgi:hypothetical protein